MVSFLRINSSVSGAGMFSRSALRWDSASSICASTDLLSQPRAIPLLYAHAAQIESHALHFSHQSQRVFAVDLADFSGGVPLFQQRARQVGPFVDAVEAHGSAGNAV